MNRILILATIIIFGFSAFFRKMAVDRVHPYHLQIISAIVYLSLAPVWHHLAPKNMEFNAAGFGFAALTTCLHILGAVCFGLLLRGSNSTGALSVMISASPLVTTLLSVAFMGEKMEVRHVLATFLTLAGLTLFNVR